MRELRGLMWFLLSTTERDAKCLRRYRQTYLKNTGEEGVT